MKRKFYSAPRCRLIALRHEGAMMTYSLQLHKDSPVEKAVYHETTHRDPFTLENFGEEQGEWSNKSEGGIW